VQTPLSRVMAQASWAEAAPYFLASASNPRMRPTAATPSVRCRVWHSVPMCGLATSARRSSCWVARGVCVAGHAGSADEHGGGEHGRHLTFGGAVDARVGPTGSRSAALSEVVFAHDRRRIRPCLCRESSNAGCVGSTAGRFRITHPFHPLHGAEYELVTRKLTWVQQPSQARIGQGGPVHTIHFRE
jgi:hypothetical protein